MPTLSSLPPELLYDILEHLVHKTSITSFASETFWWPSHYEVLASAALVARAWRAPASQLLHRHLAFDSDEQAQLWLANHDRSVEVRTVVLRDLPSEWAERVLAEPEVVPESLAIAANSIELNQLQMPKLQALKTLLLRTRVAVPAEETSIHLPFNLTSLALSSYPVSPALLPALLSPTLRVLDLAHVATTLPLESFIPIFPLLTSLSLPSLNRQLLHFLPLLASATSLVRLSVASTHPALLAVIPTSVTELQVKGLCEFPSVEKALSRLAALRELRLPRRGVPRTVAGTEELQSKEALGRECSKRGIRVWFGEDEGLDAARISS